MFGVPHGFMGGGATGIEDKGPTPGGTTSFGSTSLTWVDRDNALTNGQTVFKVLWYSTKVETGTVKVVRYNSASDVDVVVTESFSHGGTGWEEKSLAVPFFIPNDALTYYSGVWIASAGVTDTNSRNDWEASTDITGDANTGSEFAARATPATGVEY